MIPKIIHYIWLGDKPLPKIAKKCIRSWKKFCPDYEIKRWDESNLDLDCCTYVRESYDNKKFAFASDVLRLQKIYEFGGIYLDIDVEILRPIDDLLGNYCFTGFETSNLINPGIIFGSEKGNSDLKEILDGYYKRSFIKNGRFDLTTICETVTDYYNGYGLVRNNKTQNLKSLVAFSSEYFSPIDVITNKKKITKNTYSIHWFNASWYSLRQKLKNKFKKFMNYCTFGFFGKMVRRIKK